MGWSGKWWVAALFCLGNSSLAQPADRCPAHAGYPPDPWAVVKFSGTSTLPLEMVDIYHIARRAKEKPGQRVCVVGLSDNFGDRTYNASLASERLRTVTNAFSSRGLARDEVAVTTDQAVLRKLIDEGKLKLGVPVNDNRLIILFVFSHDGGRSS